MKNILIIGASGSIAQVARRELLEKTDAQLTLLARRPKRVKILDANRERLVAGDVTDDSILRQVMQGQDVVYANLAGAMDDYAAHIVRVMQEVGIKRLIFITTMEIYQEIPAWLGESPEPYNNYILAPYRKAADIIEASDLDYTILRPGWLDNANDTNYELTAKGEAFGGMGVSRLSMAHLIVRLVIEDGFGIRESYGVNRPE